MLINYLNTLFKPSVVSIRKSVFMRVEKQFLNGKMVSSESMKVGSDLFSFLAEKPHTRPEGKKIDLQEEN